MSDEDRAYALGFMVLDLAGDGFFKKVFSGDARTRYEWLKVDARVETVEPSPTEGADDSEAQAGLQDS